MKATYPALFYYDENETAKYFIHFPDFKGSVTQGVDLADAMFMASDRLGLNLASLLEAGKSLPSPSDINRLSLVNNDPFKDEPDFATTYDLSKSFISMVPVDVSKYLTDDTVIKKTLTIPKWADTAGKRLDLNFSQTLTEAIAERLANS